MSGQRVATVAAYDTTAEADRCAVALGLNPNATMRATVYEAYRAGLSGQAPALVALSGICDAVAAWCEDTSDDCQPPVAFICEIAERLEAAKAHGAVYVLTVEAPDWTRAVTVHAERSSAEAVVRAIYLTLSSPRFAALDAVLTHDVIVERLVGDHGYTVTIDACPAPEPGQ